MSILLYDSPPPGKTRVRKAKRTCVDLRRLADNCIRHLTLNVSKTSLARALTLALLMAFLWWNYILTLFGEGKGFRVTPLLNSSHQSPYLVFFPRGKPRKNCGLLRDLFIIFSFTPIPPPHLHLEKNLSSRSHPSTPYRWSSASLCNCVYCLLWAFTVLYSSKCWGIAAVIRNYPHQRNPNNPKVGVYLLWRRAIFFPSGQFPWVLFTWFSFSRQVRIACRIFLPLWNVAGIGNSQRFFMVSRGRGQYGAL